jgi:NAD(P)-dependent dehydrogenase (short-subunit alcohol dehydrogenase family)
MPDAPVALVTGASRGIGRQLCVDLAAAGYDVICVARSTDERPGKLAGTIDATTGLVEEHGRRALPIAVDVRDATAVGYAVDQVEAEFGRLDLVVNNAAVAPPGATLDLPLKLWQLTVDVNLNGPLYLAWHAGRLMLAAGAGRIVNISSGAAVAPEFGRTSYTVSKAALEMLTRCLAYELAPAVAVNCLRLDVPVRSEGFEATLGPDADIDEFEDPVIVSDAVLHFAAAPLDVTGQIATIAQLRDQGVVRAP